MAKTLTIYFDEIDQSNMGWAYRVDDLMGKGHTESGAIDSLDDLLQVVNEYHDILDAFTSCDLPTFGGIEPDSTVGIYSWDATRLLVPGDESHWVLIERDAYDIVVEGVFDD